jgi:secondary thiamine-phosphate synthase enzyme
VRSIIKDASITDGLVTVFCPGSTGAITTVEYESGVLQDLKQALERIAPSNIPYQHDGRWGDGNGFAHVRAALMKPSLSIPLAGGKMTLGTWQQIVFIDFDNRERQRQLVVQVMGK